MAERIKPNQLRKIYAVARELKIDDDLLHALVYGVTGKEQISKLTKRQAGLVIDELERRAGRGRAAALATNGQRQKISYLEEQLGWRDNPNRLRKFCLKYAGVEDPSWLTKDKAWRVIEGLKALAARQPGACRETK